MKEMGLINPEILKNLFEMVYISIDAATVSSFPFLWWRLPKYHIGIYYRKLRRTLLFVKQVANSNIKFLNFSTLPLYMRPVQVEFLC